jgi:SAM-dependent methyltransferase
VSNSNHRASFEKITLVSVTGLPDARGAAMALQHSQAQMPGARALLCSPQAPHDLAPGIEHLRIAPLNYHEYGWFMMFALWRVVTTEFALVVQEDGWVVNADNWRDEFLGFDYIGAPIHLAKIDTPQGTYWRNRFAWADEMDKPGHVVTPIQNGGFSLRSRRFMRALIDHPHIRVEIPPPDAVEGDPLRMHWQHNALLEDVQLSGVLRPALEAVGMRFAPLELARSFSIEHAGPQLHHGYNAMLLFGHHAKMRQLASLSPLTLRSLIPLPELDAWYGERDILQMFERNGYRIEFAPEPVASKAAPRKVYDCITYNGEADILAARLHELSEVVDCFVIVEADRTFSGEPKALRFDAADPRIASFLPRIRYIAVHDMPVVDGAADAMPVVGDWHSDTPKSGFWTREKFQRNQIVRGLHDASPDDLVLISDADEIPRASMVRAMRDDRRHALFGLCLAFYYFYANYRNVEGPEASSVWTVAATRAQLDALTPDQLRMRIRTGAQPALILADAGWHLSYLAMDEDAVRAKVRGFAHQEYNAPEFLAAIDIPALLASGKDLYDRPGYAWRVVGRDEAPQWLASQPALAHLFAVPSSDATRYAKESYVTVEPSPFGFWERHANRRILQAYAPFIRGRVLDLGCNHGASTYWLRENPAVTEVIGVDLNEHALDLARELFASVPMPSMFVGHDMTADGPILPPADTVVSFHTLEHIYADDVPDFLASACQSLAPGGHFVISIPYDRAYPDPCHVGFYNEASLARAMEAAGLEIVECFKDDRFDEKDLLTGLFRRP